MSPARAASIPAGSYFRILCVDDDGVSQRLLMMALARPGWSVECVCDGRHAIERFRDDPWGFDLLVTDHAMPGVDGAELVRELRGIGFHGEAIVVTAGLTTDDAARYRAQGVGVVLLKPIDAPRLRSVVALSLERAAEQADASRRARPAGGAILQAARASGRSQAARGAALPR